MRHEVEISFGRDASDFDRLRDLLTTLGFEPVRPVEKTRALYHLIWNRRELELAVDAVGGLGAFLEIESLADDSDREEARDVILEVAERLGLKEPERRSYLQLLLDAEGKGKTSGAKNSERPG
jgi:adenylate cyclase class 2